MAGRCNRIQVIDSVQRLVAPVCRAGRAGQTHRSNLRVGQVRRSAWNRKAQSRKENRNRTRISVEESRKGDISLADQVGSAKSRNIASQSEAKLIVKDSPACVNNCFGRN